MNDTQRPEWLSLMDFANYRGVSLSTLRRYIKSKKVEFRIENGKYWIKAATDVRTPYSRNISPVMNHADSTSHAETESLRRELQRAHKEIADLKTLIALYEESIPKRRADAPSPIEL